MEPKPKYITEPKNMNPVCPIDKGSTEPTDLMYCLKRSRAWAPGLDGDKTFCEWCEMQIALQKLRK